VSGKRWDERPEGPEERLDEALEEVREIRAGLWQNLAQVAGFVGDLTGLSPLWDRISGWVGERAAARGPVAFTVALIALSAKMAKADGIVTAEEVATFRRVVEIPPGEERNVERLFDLAQRDVAGFEAHATRIRDLAKGDTVFLEDVLEGLFLIAAADTFVHEHEMAFLERVAEIFGLGERRFEAIAAGFVRRRGPDPYRVLGVARDADDEAVKKAWRKAVAECHPDRHFAHGLPAEAMAILTDRLAGLNAAWEAVRLERGLAK
jgi:DnaJ like chaperone protein